MKVTWKAGEILCHASKRSEAEQVATEYMLALENKVFEVVDIEEEELRKQAAAALP
ncbi:MAG: hypothetical protein ACRDQZ_25480 [Mycobacteriales bacterium]